MSYGGGGGGVDHVIFNLLLGVGHSVLCEMEGVGHVFSNHHILKCSGPPPPPVLFDQSLIHFFCLCPPSLAIKMNFNISKVAYQRIRHFSACDRGLG